MEKMQNYLKLTSATHFICLCYVCALYHSLCFCDEGRFMVKVSGFGFSLYFWNRLFFNLYEQTISFKQFPTQEFLFYMSCYLFSSNFHQHFFSKWGRNHLFQRSGEYKPFSYNYPGKLRETQYLNCYSHFSVIK